MGHIGKIFHVHIPGDSCAKYEVSMTKPVARRMKMQDDNNDNTQRAVHDYIGSLAYVLNEPMTENIAHNLFLFLP